MKYYGSFRCKVNILVLAPNQSSLNTRATHTQNKIIGYEHRIYTLLTSHTHIYMNVVVPFMLSRHSSTTWKIQLHIYNIYAYIFMYVPYVYVDLQ